MRYTTWSFTFVCLLTGACGGVDPEAPPASTQSLEVLRVGPVTRASLPLRQSVSRAASRLCDLSADILGDSARNGLVDADPDDGGWDWTLPPSSTSHSSEASPENLYGAVALAPWAAWRMGIVQPRARGALRDAFLGAERNVLVDSPPDFVWLVLLDDVLKNGRAPALARERYDARVVAAGGARAQGEAIRDSRHAAGADGLIAYDLTWLALGALALDGAFPNAGYHADFETYAAIVVDDLTSPSPDFDYRDPHEAFYTQGLAWSLVAASFESSTRPLFVDLRERLLAAQLADGAWAWSGDYPAANLQVTAHALMALSLGIHGRFSPFRARRAAASFLISRQQDNGGWLSTDAQAGTPAEEAPLLDAEIVLSVYLAETGEGLEDGLGQSSAGRHISPLSVLPALAPALSAPGKGS